MSWVPDSAMLRAERQRLGLSIEALAAAAELSEKTVRNLEHRATRTTRQRTLEAIVKVLDCDLEDVASPASPERGRRRPRPPESTQLPEGSRLDALAALEQRLGRVPPTLFLDGMGAIEPLTAKRLQDVMTTYALDEGCRMWTTAWVRRQHHLTDAEARVLGCDPGVGARFLLVREIARNQPLFVTVYSASAEMTRSLRAKAHSDLAASVLLQVIIARAAGGMIRVTPATGRRPVALRLGGEWTGFRFHGIDESNPWTFVARRVVPATSDATTTS